MTAAHSVRWIEAQQPHGCGECFAPIQPGERMAAWREVFVTIAGRAGEATHSHIDRIFCAECGELLEDSLTTTDDSEQLSVVSQPETES